MTTEQLKSLISQLPELDVPTPDSKEKMQARDKGKLTGPQWSVAAEKIFDPILADGPAAVEGIIQLIPDKDVGSDYKARYAIHALAVYTTRPGKEKQRAIVQQALLAQLGKSSSKIVQSLIMRTLQYAGDASAVPALAGYLNDVELVDPAALAMVALKGDAAKLLAAALEKASGRSKLAIIQALGGLVDSTALAGLTAAAKDEDVDTRVTAWWALSRTGLPQAASVLIEATGATETWPRNQATDAALSLADALAARNLKEPAAKIYQHLYDTRTARDEAHVKAAAQRGLEKLK